MNFLFIKEVKVAKPEELKNLETHEEESSEWKEKEALQEEEASELEEEREEASESEEGEHTSGLEEEGEEASELEEGEDNSGLEKEDSELEKEGLEATVLYKEQHSTFQPHTIVNAKHGFEITSEGLENIIIKEIEDSDQEEEEDSEWELEVFLTWEEGKDFEVEKVKTASQIVKKEASHGLQEIAVSYLPSDSEKKKFMKR